MTETKTKEQILDETIKAYNLNTRSVIIIEENGEKDARCAYLSPEGRKCAFSRCCTDEGVAFLHEHFEDGGVARFIDQIEEMVKPEYRGHEYQFWGHIQNLHDVEGYWNETGLSEDGKMQVNSLIKLYKLNYTL